MNKGTIFSYALLLGIGGIALYFISTKQPMDQITPEPSATPIQSSAEADVILKTNKGDIAIDLFEEQMPITTGNFLKLAQEGYYNATKFHRVIPGFMIQGGDSSSKGDDKDSYGTGGPGYTIQDEFVAGLSNVRGTIAMANTGAPNSGGSQFFINLVDNTGLDFDKPPMTSSHPVFGQVVSGMEVVDAIAQVQRDASDVPLEPVVIESIEIK
jgi:peptidylprolyl isomerase